MRELQSVENFRTGLVMMFKVYDMNPIINDDVLEVIDNIDALDDSMVMELKSILAKSFLNLGDKSISIPCIVKKDGDIYRLFTINRNVSGALSSPIEIRTLSPWEFIDLKTNIPLWFIKSIESIISDLNITKEEVFCIETVEFEDDKSYINKKKILGEV